MELALANNVLQKNRLALNLMAHAAVCAYVRPCNQGPTRHFSQIAVMVVTQSQGWFLVRHEGVGLKQSVVHDFCSPGKVVDRKCCQICDCLTFMRAFTRAFARSGP